MFFLGFVNSQTVSLWDRGGCRVDFDGESSGRDPSVSPPSLPIESEEMGNTIEIFIRGRQEAKVEKMRRADRETQFSILDR